MTTARYYTPNGRSIQAEGIEPDIKLKSLKVAADDTDTNFIKESDLSGHLNNDRHDRTDDGAPPDDTDSITISGEAADSAQNDYALYEALNLLRGMSRYCKITKTAEYRPAAPEPASPRKKSLPWPPYLSHSPGCEELKPSPLSIYCAAPASPWWSRGWKGTVTASRAGHAAPETTLAEVLDQDFDMVVLPGGLGGAQRLEADQRIAALLRRMAEQGRYIAAICAAPRVLAGAGLLDNREATAYPGILDGQAGIIQQRRRGARRHLHHLARPRHRHGLLP